MQDKTPTIIIRHRRENLKKCSLRGLESSSFLKFLTYPNTLLPPIENYVLLSMNAPPLTQKDANKGLILLDATWKLAQKMEKVLLPQLKTTQRRSLPLSFYTAYPRRQDDCQDPQKGLATLEALWIAHTFLKKPTDKLLDHYYWRSQFLEINALQIQKLSSH